MIRVAAALCGATLILPGCNQAPRTTMDLLRAGDTGVCIAKDVEDTLRQLILPKVPAAKDYAIAFADASLEAFDKTVNRATCNAALTVTGPDGVAVVERTMIDYVVAPTAQNPSTFLVSADTNPYRAIVQQEIDRVDEMRWRSQRMEEAEAALVATVKPGWLLGRWVDGAAGSQACTDGPYEAFERGGRYETSIETGRWKLAERTLAVVTPAAAVTYEISEAGADTLSMAPAGGDLREMRRCAGGEIAVPDAPPPEDLTSDLQQAEELEAQQR